MCKKITDVSQRSKTTVNSNSCRLPDFLAHAGIHINFVSIRYCILQQMPIKTTSPHTIPAFLVLVLVNFLQMQFQGKVFSPFETNPKTMWGYCLAYDGELRLSSSHLNPAAYYPRVIRGGMGLSGSLLSVSLASLLFQDSVWLVVCFLYIVFSNRQMMYCRLHVLWSWLREKMLTGLSQ